MIARLFLVCRLTYNDDVARRSPDQLAVFQRGPSRTGGKAPISGFIRVESGSRPAAAGRKNSQPAAARRVALKMGRRPQNCPATLEILLLFGKKFSDIFVSIQSL